MKGGGLMEGWEVGGARRLRWARPLREKGAGRVRLILEETGRVDARGDMAGSRKRFIRIYSGRGLYGVITALVYQPHDFHGHSASSKAIAICS
jgi:hypothetical protein